MLGFFLTFIIIFFTFIIIIASIASFSKKDEVTVPKNTVLHLKFDKPITDRTPIEPFEEFGFSFNDNKKLGLDGIIENLKKAKEDKNIKGIYLDLSDIPSGLATIEEIRNALLDFKESGKFIISYSEVYTQKAYYLATVSDKIYLNPEGFLDFRGFIGQVMFLKGTLEKLDVDMQIIKHGKFKSAVEPLILDKMSEANKEQTLTYISSMWNHVTKQISKSRKISIEQLNEIADSVKIQVPEDAIKYKLVDKLMFKDELLAELKQKLDIKKNKKISSLDLGKYSKTAAKSHSKRSKNKIAVIYAIGGVESGEGDDETIGSERISKAIRLARNDSSIKAIVLRVNSPGGSALASEVIWREINLAKKTKPVIASMGDVAASGGYYILCPANKIFAHENTITGSIGVFGVLPNMENFLKNKLGITFDNVKTNTFSDFGSPLRALSPYENSVITVYIERIYQTFLQHVAEGRNMTTAEVDSIAQGRVWSGNDAKRIGLVDEIGGLDDAIAYAAKTAKLEKYRIVYYPKQKDPFKEIIEKISDNTQTSFIKKELGESYIYFEHLKSISKMDEIQARLPYSIDIK